VIQNAADSPCAITTCHAHSAPQTDAWRFLTSSTQVIQNQMRLFGEGRLSCSLRDDMFESVERHGPLPASVIGVAAAAGNNPAPSPLSAARRHEVHKDFRNQQLL